MFRFVVLAALLALASGVPLDRVFGSSPIVGGDQATITDAPWQVALLLNSRLSCGGSIISSTKILTAAHCTNGRSASSLSVRVGSSFHASGGSVHQVNKIANHPQFKSNTFDYDFAVLTLATAISIDNTNTRIIPLAAAGQSVPAGSSALITGWGTTSSGGSAPAQIRKLTIPVVDQAKCADAYKNINTITDRMMCAGNYDQGGKDSCQGDSGGPFVVSGVLVGVTSWGNDCALPKYPGVYARIPVVVDWIKAQM